MVFPTRRAAPGAALLTLLLVGSCASMKTQQQHYVESEPLAREGDYLAAAQIIEDSKDKTYKEKDRVLYWIDLGMLLHWAGEYERSNEVLTQAEYAIEELFTKSVSKALVSGVLNDNALDYWGEDYEDIYINIFKGLNYVALGNEEAALVEMRRVQIKLDLLEDKYKELVEQYNTSEEAEGEIEARENRFYNDALARYLSLLLYRTENSFDDARIDREKIEEAWTDQAHLYPHPMPTLPEIAVEEGKALVNVLAFTGMNPVKLAETFYVDSGASIVFITSTDQSEEYVTNVVGFNFLIIPGIQPGIHFKYQFPRLTTRGSEVDRVVFKLDGAIVGEIPLFENMDAIARETFLLKQPVIVGRTIIRATIKNVAKEVGKEAAQDSLEQSYGGWGWLAGAVAGIAADVAVDATENADLRNSHFLPAYANAAEFSVSPGTYWVSVEYWSGDTLLTTVDHGERTFTEEGLNLVESHILR